MLEVKGGRILVVDHDAPTRAARGRVLRDAGHTVFEAEYLSDAGLLRQRPELLVLDAAFHDQINEEFSDTMVLRISSASAEPGREADASLVEPVAADVLISTASTLLRLGRAERALRASAAEANDATRIKDDFLGTLSHELRTPLHAIVGWIALLRTRQFDDDARAKALEVIDRNARAETKLIEDLLDVSHISLGQLRLTWQTVELAPIVCSALDAIAATAEAKGVTISTDVALDPDITVHGDPERLRQVFWNLASNAVKFTPAGGHVDVHAHAANGHAEVEVTDSGRGISAECLPRVFERFGRTDRRTTSPDRGLGLGLAIARELTELHGGTVTAASDGVDKGATFVVTLPSASAMRARTGARAAVSTRPV
jgi:signal transduction histidine kinase